MLHFIKYTLNSIHPTQQINIMIELDSQVIKNLQLKKGTKLKNIKNLLKAQSNKNSIKCNHQFYPRVVNKSDIVLNYGKFKMLNKGFNFNFLDNRINSSN